MQRGSTTPDLFLDAKKIRAATCVRHVEIHDTLGSTNVRALELSHNTEIELPALVVARLQTAGRGRGRNTWWAADGALTFSLLLEAATVGIIPMRLPQLSLCTAVAVCDALADCIGEQAWAPPPPPRIGLQPAPAREKSTPQLQIKWPNDVLLNGRKICGILIESPGGTAPAKNRLIVGIGININNSWHHAPHELKSSGTALRDVTNSKHDLQAVLGGVLNAFAKRADQLRRCDERLVRAWQDRDSLNGQHVALKTTGGEIKGDCAGIAKDGAIVLNTSMGQQRFYSGSVRRA